MLLERGAGFVPLFWFWQVTNYPVVRHLWQAARLWGTCNYPLSLFACLFRQAHALRSFGQPIYIEVSGLRVIQVPHGLSCLLDRKHLARSAEKVRQRGDSSPTKFVNNKTRAKQRRTKEPARCRFLSREAGNLVSRSIRWCR